MSKNTNQSLLDEYNYKINISAYENLTEREQHIHQSAFMTGYKLGQEHTIKSKTITKFVYVPKGNNPNKQVRVNINKTAKRRKSYCARSAGQMKRFPKAAKNPNSRLRQARRRWKC